MGYLTVRRALTLRIVISASRVISVSASIACICRLTAAPAEPRRRATDAQGRKSIDTPSKILFGRRRLAGLAGIGQARAERRFYGRSRHSSEGVSTRRSCYGNATCLLALLARANWPPRITNDLNSASPPETTSTYSSLPSHRWTSLCRPSLKGEC